VADPSGPQGVSAAVIRSNGLRRTYETGGGAIEALHGVTFSVARGEMLAIRGPSGSGKSTLISLLACADRPTAGSLEIAGTRVERLSDRALRPVRRRDLGIVFQNFHLLEGLTVRENVALPLALLGRDRTEIGERVNRTLELLDISELQERYPSALSGGQAQRAAIARAVVHEPAIVLADEPTGNLDSHTGANIVRLLRNLATAGQTLVVATHAESVAAVCDRTLWLRDGTISG
jgi:putative ABC transport system ATP-binding protein